jgi:hypothetical protein
MYYLVFMVWGGGGPPQVTVTPFRDYMEAKEVGEGMEKMIDRDPIMGAFQCKWHIINSRRQFELASMRDPT